MKPDVASTQPLRASLPTGTPYELPLLFGIDHHVQVVRHQRQVAGTGLHHARLLLDAFNGQSDTAMQVPQRSAIRSCSSCFSSLPLTSIP